MANNLTTNDAREKNKHRYEILRIFRIFSKHFLPPGRSVGRGYVLQVLFFEKKLPITQQLLF
jgi:hypothetical protein